MTRLRTAALPVAAGCALLAVSWWLLPGRGEVATAAARAAPAPVVRAVPPAAPPSGPATPALATLVASADAAALARETARLAAAGVPVSTQQVAWDLKAAGRAMVALDYLALRPNGATAATWRLRVELARSADRPAAVTALLETAARRPGTAPTQDLIEAAYQAQRPDLVAAAMIAGVVPPMEAAPGVDLVRRLDAARRHDLIAQLDAAVPSDWRARDPWLAMRVAMHANDRAAAMRAAALFPPGQRDAAREAVLTRAGDQAALRALWLAQAARPGADRAALAERLLEAGWREDARAVLRAAATGGADERVARRLLFLMGPRPEAEDLAWLRRRAATDAGWLAAYAERDRPAAALAFLATHPLAATTPVLLMRLRLARATGDAAAGRTALATVLDGRPLDAETLRRAGADQPRGLPPALAEALTARRITAGVAAPDEARDLAWSAWNRGDAGAAERWLTALLRIAPEDAGALRLMADVQARRGGAKAARPWLNRALAATPEPSRERADLLDRLGRRDEALLILAGLRADAPRDRALAAMHARILLAAGRPGQARAVLAP